MAISELGPTIPRIIHQTSGQKELPLMLQESIADLKALNPGWVYRYYSHALQLEHIAEFDGLAMNSKLIHGS